MGLLATSRYNSVDLSPTANSIDCSKTDILDSFATSRREWLSSVFVSVTSDKTLHLPLGSCTILIGPHVFANCQFYKTRAKIGPLSNHRSSKPTYSPPKNISHISTPPTSPLASPIDRFDIIFEFQDSPGVWWLLPRDVKLKTQSLKEPYQVTVSFPQRAIKSLPDPFYQQANQSYVYIYGVQKELWAELQLALIDFCVDDEFEAYHPRPKIILKQSQNHHNDSVDKYYCLSQSDSDSDFASDPWGSSPCPRKFPKVHGHGLTDKVPDKMSIIAKRVNTSPNSGGIGKKCGYCGCKSTPMWRRGPAGPGTLCNACGVKWKHGKIMQEQSVKYEKLLGSTRGRAGSSRDLSTKVLPIVLIDTRRSRNTTPASSTCDEDCADE
ncbi:hypothetical protein K493DRAFT_333876 [Basidiobolus meristosporus CBS 931.73]|uniref:GATA-type domain-containing protein n=1 Tax=Basidiobolus meristosporus CBS 931.73 TaxID=1314790 RepID=A0A1Y1Z465_9FUNG|nr:hypothetical protein K493DRAFT_333876 [Basidiobolus meristosporus CBS 931.73]|eukprot:ORY04635.1 hypothetical protein K493DRAFT_333876 [Basidiobolus meristosporus CBS 931.73]